MAASEPGALTRTSPAARRLLVSLAQRLGAHWGRNVTYREALEYGLTYLDQHVSDDELMEGKS